MTRRRLVVLILSVIVALLLSVVAVSCAREGGFMGLGDGSGNPAPPISIPRIGAPTGDEDNEEDESAGITGSFEKGDLLFNALTVERHGLDLTTFMKAVAAELESTERVEITDMSLDGDIRPDGSPVSVISFFILDPGSEVSLVGRHYAVVTPDGDGFTVMTCVTDADFVDQCDDEMRLSDLSTFQ